MIDMKISRPLKSYAVVE